MSATVNLAPLFRQQWFNNGAPVAGGQLFSYQAGTTTPQNTYTDSTGVTPNANPVILDANGEANVWLDQTLSYKFVLEDALNNVLWTVDGIPGALAAGSVTTSAIAAGAVTTAKLAANSVTSTILSSDASIDANRAVTTNSIQNTQVTGAKLAGSAVASAGMCNIGLSAAVASNALTVTLTDAGGGTPSTASPVDINFRNATATTGTPTFGQATAATSITLPSGATIGMQNVLGQNLFVWVYALLNGSTVELAISSSRSFDEGIVQSTTILNGSSTSAGVLYSTTARTNVPVRLIGRVTIDLTLTGWSTAPTNVSLYYPDIYQVRPSEIILNGVFGTGYGSTNTMFRLFNGPGSNWFGNDITHAVSATLGTSFTINTPGLYSMTYWDNFSASQYAAITRNDSQGTTSMASDTITQTNVLAEESATAANEVISISCVEWLNAGDVIRAHTDGTSSGTKTSNGQGFRIIKLS